MVYVAGDRLIADSVQELILFIRMLGLPPVDVQEGPGEVPHVKLDPALRDRAIGMGAVAAGPPILQLFRQRVRAGEWALPEEAA